MSSGKISHSSMVLQLMNHRACPFISSSSTTCDHANWKLRLLKKWQSLHGLVGLNCGAPMFSMGGHCGYYRLRHCGGGVDKT